MIKASLTAVQTSQGPLTLNQGCELANIAKPPDASWTSAEVALRHCSRTQPRPGFLQGTDYILLPPPLQR